MTHSLYEKQINALLTLYTDVLYKDFGATFLTPANQALIERKLVQIQQQKQREEPQTNLYKLPVKVVFNLNEHRFDVVLANNNNSITTTTTEKREEEEKE